MTRDSITDEIRSIRRELAARFGNDVGRILADARHREAGDGRTYITLSARRVIPTMDEQSDAPKPPVTRVLDETSSPAAG